MFHAIGRRARAGKLVDMLLECHGRIREFCDLAVAVGERRDAPHSEIAEACSRVERYFTDALPLHVMDEEESILPRLRGRSGAIDAALGCMSDQHEMHVPLVERLLTCAAAVRRAPEDPEAMSALSWIARPLRAVLETHLRVEEDVLFPSVAALVPVEEQRVIVREMHERRRR